ncbi:MAG: hypothetical protein ABJN26_11160 [Stappiaceae bacterium]
MNRQSNAETTGMHVNLDACGLTFSAATSTYKSMIEPKAPCTQATIVGVYYYATLP